MNTILIIVGVLLWCAAGFWAWVNVVRDMGRLDAGDLFFALVFCVVGPILAVPILLLQIPDFKNPFFKE